MCGWLRTSLVTLAQAYDALPKCGRCASALYREADAHRCRLAASVCSRAAGALQLALETAKRAG
jgi:hypothetical protein